MILEFCASIAMQAAIVNREWQYQKQASTTLIEYAVNYPYYMVQTLEAVRQQPADTVELKENIIADVYESELSFCEFRRGL